MTLPKPKKRKLIKKNIIKLAQEVQKILEEELYYVHDQKIKNGYILPSSAHHFPQK